MTSVKYCYASVLKTTNLEKSVGQVCNSYTVDKHLKREVKFEIAPWRQCRKAVSWDPLRVSQPFDARRFASYGVSTRMRSNVRDHESRATQTSRVTSLCLWHLSHSLAVDGDMTPWCVIFRDSSRWKIESVHFGRATVDWSEASLTNFRSLLPREGLEPCLEL